MPLTKNEKNLVLLLKIWAFLLASCAMVLFFQGNRLIETFNLISQKFNLPLSALALPVENFWMTLTMSLMFLLVFLCVAGIRDIRQNAIVVPAILISKFTSSFFFFFYFMKSSQTLAYLIGLLTDGSMFLVTYYFYSKIKYDLKQS